MGELIAPIRLGTNRAKLLAHDYAKRSGLLPLIYLPQTMKTKKLKHRISVVRSKAYATVKWRDSITGKWYCGEVEGIEIPRPNEAELRSKIKLLKK